MSDSYYPPQPPLILTTLERRIGDLGPVAMVGAQSLTWNEHARCWSGIVTQSIPPGSLIRIPVPPQPAAGGYARAPMTWPEPEPGEEKNVVTFPPVTASTSSLLAWSHGDRLVITRPYDYELDAAHEYGTEPELTFRPMRRPR